VTIRDVVLREDVESVTTDGFRLMNMAKYRQITHISVNEAALNSEAAYRRGFCHGAQAAADNALDLYRAGYTRQTEVYNIINEWIFVDLYTWRRRQDNEPKNDYLAPGLRIRDWKEIRKEVIARDGAVCSHCGALNEIQVDHIEPVKNGGLPTLDNLRVLCRKCNLARNHT